MINTPKHLSFLLKVELTEIRSILTNIDKYYSEIKIPKLDKNGNPKTDNSGNPRIRKINPSLNRLKVIQKRINKVILSKIEMPEYAYGGIKNRDNIVNAKQHQGKKYKFTTDLKDFFPSISNKSVYAMFINNKFSPDVSSILTKLTTYKGSIPQGAPTSTTLANLVFCQTGKNLYEFSKKNELTFTSFVDDLSFSSKKDFKDKVPYILEIITKDYKISHQKTHYSRNPNITGLHPMNNWLKLPTSFHEKLKTIGDMSIDQQKGLFRYRQRVQEINKSKMSPTTSHRNK